ncbi:MAG: MerR family transcriptional regulator [Chloroflexi bacterium]|nr:MerR family transcriptional regulator [Chloroflexota bacterium]
MGSSRPFFTISVVSEMLEMHPQTIRNYERLGLIRPHRTRGNVRLFSHEDVQRLQRINSFTELGVNLAGVEMLLRMADNMESMRQEMEEEMRRMEAELNRFRDQL